MRDDQTYFLSRDFLTQLLCIEIDLIQLMRPNNNRQRYFVRTTEAIFTIDHLSLIAAQQPWRKSLGQLKFSSKTDSVIDGSNVLLWSYSASN